jgi:hypothetical protein
VLVQPKGFFLLLYICNHDGLSFGYFTKLVVKLQYIQKFNVIGDCYKLRVVNDTVRILQI